MVPQRLMRRLWMFWLFAGLGLKPLWGQNSINVSCPSSGSAGITISCTVSLSLGTGVSVDSLTFGLGATPVGSAPSLNGANLGFATAISNTFASGTPNAVAVLASPSPALTTGSVTLGTASVPLPLGAADGQSYSIAFSNVSATFNNNLVNVLLGPAATVGITQSMLALSRTSLNFGSLAVSSSSSGQAVLLNNTGVNTLSLSFSITGDYGQTTNCGSTIAPAASCTVTVTFTPTVAGPRSGTLGVAVGGPASPLQVRLFGAGTSGPLGALVGLSTTALNFGTQATGVPTSQATVTLANIGDATLTVNGVSASTDFAQTNNCGSVAASATCTINVTFTPSTTGRRSGAITILDSASSSPHLIRLSGSGTSGTAPAIGLSSIAVNFGSQLHGVTSSVKTVTVTNTGTASLNITAVNPSGDFGVSGCMTTLTAGTNCTLNITFTPSTTGVRTGAVFVTDNASASPQVIRLFGKGT